MSEMDTATGESGEREREADPSEHRTDHLRHNEPHSVGAPAKSTSAMAGPPILPSLPHHEARSTLAFNKSTGAPGARRTYRSEQARSKAVYRRANPWWRRGLRALVVAGLLVTAGVVVYFGVGLVQDFMGRERLPSAGTEAPDIGSATFQITSSSPSPTIDGTLSLDFETLAFEFVGRPTGPQEGLQVVSPAGTSTYLRTTGSGWRAANPEDGIISALQTAIPFLRNVDGPGAVLENRLRQGSVQLVDEVDEGVDDDQLRRYELEIDTNDYSVNWPVQWNIYREEVIPALGIGNAVPIVMTLDADNVVVRLAAPQSNWAWERLTYSEFGISVTDPTRV